MLQVVTFNLIKSQLRKSKINALLFNSSATSYETFAATEACILQIQSATAADREPMWERESV